MKTIEQWAIAIKRKTQNHENRRTGVVLLFICYLCVALVKTINEIQVRDRILSTELIAES